MEVIWVSSVDCDISLMVRNVIVQTFAFQTYQINDDCTQPAIPAESTRAFCQRGCESHDSCPASPVIFAYRVRIRPCTCRSPRLWKPPPGQILPRHLLVCSSRCRFISTCFYLAAELGLNSGQEINCVDSTSPTPLKLVLTFT